MYHDLLENQEENTWERFSSIQMLTPIYQTNDALKDKIQRAILEMFDPPNFQLKKSYDRNTNISQDVQSYSPELNQRPLWTYEQELNFFRFLGGYLLHNPGQLQSWKKFNKKGIFINMQARIKTKNRTQCRLKFWNYKRKHSDKKKQLHYQTCMKSLILKKLIIFGESDRESRLILKQIQERQKKITDMKRNLNDQIIQLKYEIAYVQKLYESITMKQAPKNKNLFQKLLNQEQICKKTRITRRSKLNQIKVLPTIDECNSSIQEQYRFKQQKKQQVFILDHLC